MPSSPLGVNPTYSTFNFDKEYLYGYETLVFATSGILSMHNNLWHFKEKANLKSHHMTPLSFMTYSASYEVEGQSLNSVQMTVHTT